VCGKAGRLHRAEATSPMLHSSCRLLRRRGFIRQCAFGQATHARLRVLDRTAAACDGGVLQGGVTSASSKAVGQPVLAAAVVRVEALRLTDP